VILKKLTSEQSEPDKHKRMLLTNNVHPLSDNLERKIQRREI